MILPERVFGRSGTMRTAPRAGDLADHFIPFPYTTDSLIASLAAMPRFERDIDLWHAALDLIGHRTTAASATSGTSGRPFSISLVRAGARRR